MPTPIGSGPNGGILVQEDDGSQHEIVGNKVTPIPAASPPPAEQPAETDLDRQVREAQTYRYDGPPGSAAASGQFKPENVSNADGTTGFVPPPAKPTGPQAPIVEIQQSEPQPNRAPMATPPPVASSGGGSSKAPQVDTKDFDKASLDAQEAQRAEGKARAEAAKAEGNEWTQHAQESNAALQRFQDDMKAAQAEGQKRLDAENREIEKLGQGGKVDPDHYWKSKSTGGRVLGAISLFLGGLAHGMGAENIGAKMIADDIERDVASQRFNIEQANEAQKAKVAARGTAFGHFLQLTGNAQTAALATKAWQYDAARAKVDGMKASLSAPAEIAAAEKLAALLGQKAAENKQQAVVLNSQLKTQEIQQQQARLGIEHTRLQLQQQRAVMAAQQAGALLPEQRERAVFHSSGPILVADPHEARRLRPMVASADETLREIGKMRELAKQWGSSSNKTEAGAAYALALDTVVKNINQSEGIGQALQKEQIELYKHALGNATTTPTAATLAALGKLEQSIRGSVNSQLEQAGGRAIYAAEPTEAQQAALKKAGR